MKNKSKYQPLINKINNTDSQIVYNENGIIVCLIRSFDASKLLSSRAWCINDIGAWNQYTENGINNAYFIWNFNLLPSNNKCQIGTIITPENKIKTTHLKNDVKAELFNIIKSFDLDISIFKYRKQEKIISYDEFIVYFNKKNANDLIEKTLQQHPEYLDKIYDEKILSEIIIDDVMTKTVQTKMEQLNLIIKYGYDINKLNLKNENFLNELMRTFDFFDNMFSTSSTISGKNINLLKNIINIPKINLDKTGINKENPFNILIKRMIEEPNIKIIKMIKVLISGNIDINQKTFNNETALNFLNKENDNDLINDLILLLINNGAK
jgi:hypothetical protein